MIEIRPARPDEAEDLGRICYQAFAAIAGAHNFPPDFPSVEVAQGLMRALLGNAGAFAVSAHENGRVLGSNFLHEADAVAGVGPITVDPTAQNQGLGRRLMDAVMDRAVERGAPGVRLVQSGYHCRSLSLYSKLGYEVREHLSCFQGPAIAAVIPGCSVRPATDADLPACNALCRQVHGHDRANEFRASIAQGAGRVVERAGRVSGYASQVGIFGHAVAETNDDLKALIAEARAFAGPGFLLPSSNGEMMRWCLGHGLKVIQPMTLMTVGLYNQPAGAWLPSVLY